MKKTILSLFLVLALTSCGKNPQQRFAEICEKEKDENKRQSCLCTGQELAKQLDKTRFENLVDEMEKAQTTEGSVNFSAVIKSDVLDQDTLTAFMSSAKKCGPGQR